MTILLILISYNFFMILRASVHHYRSKLRILGHAQNLVSNEVWSVGRYHRLNKQGVAWFSKSQPNFKKIKNIYFGRRRPQRH